MSRSSPGVWLALTALALPLGAASAGGPCPPNPPAPPPISPQAPPPAPEEPLVVPAAPEASPAPAPAPPPSGKAPEADAPKDLTPEEDAAARARSTRIRATLGEPKAPWTWERVLLFEGYVLGKVVVRAEPAVLAEKPVWLVSERTERSAGEGQVVSELVCYLAPDLSLLRGETVLKAPAGTEVFSFGRRNGRMEATAESEGKTQTVEAEVPADATVGLFATLHFAEAGARLRAPQTLPLVLPMFEPRAAFGAGDGKPAPAGESDLVFRAHAQGAGAAAGLALDARARSGRASTLWFGRTKNGGAAIQTVHGTFPHWSLVQSPPMGARRPDWFDRIGDAPQSAYQALCTFGRGYHLAKAELLEQAFHWPSMHAHEVETKTIEADVPLDRMKAAYIQEFLDRSKHRTVGDCDDLLTQILVTSEITKAEDGTVSIRALPVYGGHTFHCAPKDGRWWIVRVD